MNLNPSKKLNILRLNKRCGENLNQVNVKFNLLGKPMIVNQKHKNVLKIEKSRKYQFIVHNFLKRPYGKFAIFYHMFL